MKMLLTAEFPLEPFNSLVRSGKRVKSSGVSSKQSSQRQLTSQNKTENAVEFLSLTSKPRRMYPAFQSPSFLTSRLAANSGF